MLLAVAGLTSVMVLGSVPASVSATTATLPEPALGGISDVDAAFAEIIRASGLSVEEACFDLTQAVGSTHLLEGSVSDQTLTCEIPAGAAGGQELEALVQNVRWSVYWATGATAASLALADNYLTYQLLESWADQIEPCGGAWLAIELGPIHFDSFQVVPSLDTWLTCKAAMDAGGDPGPGTGTGDPGTGDGGATGQPSTYREQVEARFRVDAVRRADHNYGPHQADVAARRCVRGERAARLAGVIGVNEHPCRDWVVFIPGSDAGEAALHDQAAIASHPGWAVLSYRTLDTRVDLDRGWYRAGNFATYSGDGDCAPKPKTRGVECDEYPFYSTDEGGPGASLREVPRDQNQREGNALVSMYQDGSCAMTSGSRFFVVPVAVRLTSVAPDGTGVVNSYAGPPSGHVCTAPLNS